MLKNGSLIKEICKFDHMYRLPTHIQSLLHSIVLLIFTVSDCAYGETMFVL